MIASNLRRLLSVAEIRPRIAFARALLCAIATRNDSIERASRNCASKSLVETDTRGSSTTVSGCVKVRPAADSRTEYRPGGAVTPSSPPGPNGGVPKIAGAE